MIREFHNSSKYQFLSINKNNKNVAQATSVEPGRGRGSQTGHTRSATEKAVHDLGDGYTEHGVTTDIMHGIALRHKLNTMRK